MIEALAAAEAADAADADDEVIEQAEAILTAAELAG